MSLLSVTLSTCGNSGGNPEDPDTPKDDVDTNTNVVISEGAINDIIGSFSNPVEMAALINDLGVPFSKKFLTPTDNADEYDTNFKKSIALGILSADLGYLNVYNKTSSVVNYITVIKRIADDLKVGQFFDFQTLKRLATNNENLDSLMFLSVSSFHQMDQHLRETKRSNLSVLVVTGVWLEGLYLATQVVKEKPNDKISERIGEQKNILSSLTGILKVFSKDKNFADLLKDLQELQTAYEGVKITIVQGTPETKIENGKVVVYQKDVSIVDISQEQLINIINTTEKIRNKLIAL